MQRLIEQPTGEGDLLEDGKPLGRVHYHLSIYQHFSEAENEPVPPSLGVEGHITPTDLLDLSTLHRQGRELTLRLADGRVLSCSMADSKGTIRSTGRGLRSP